MAEMLQWHPGFKFRKNIAPMDPEDVEMIQSTPKVHIWNVSTREFIEYKGALGRFVIPACEEGHDVSKPLVIDGWLMETVVDQVEGNDVTFRWVKTSGKKLAMDLLGVGPQKTKEQDITKYGVFISAGSFYTADEKAKATAQWHRECAEMVKRADNLFQVNGGMEIGEDGKPHSAITIDHINAAKALGIKDKPWMSPSTTAMGECPACGVSIKPGVAFCTNGDIIDEAKARIARPWLFQNEEEKRGVGRPRKEA